MSPAAKMKNRAGCRRTIARPFMRSRELTGRDTEPTAAAWRKLLKLGARQIN